MRRYLVQGELALDGRVKGIKGALPSALLARARKFDGAVLPAENAREAAVVGNATPIVGVNNIRETIEFFDGTARDRSDDREP